MPIGSKILTRNASAKGMLESHRHARGRFSSDNNKSAGLRTVTHRNHGIDYIGFGNKGI